MVLTEEQKERIKKNRERALEIRRKKEEERKRAAASAASSAEKEQRTNETKKATKPDPSTTIIDSEEEESDIELEDFEIDASKFVTKQEAMKMYCLPAGTLAVCKFIEKDNPRQSKWNKMKLYLRSEVRRKSRQRFHGLDGLIQERRRRENKRFEKDFESGHDVFRKKQKR